MSSQNLLLSLSGAVDDLAALVSRAEAELDPLGYRAVLRHAKATNEALAAAILKARSLVLHFEQSRAALAPSPVLSEVAYLDDFRRRRGEPSAPLAEHDDCASAPPARRE